MFKLWAHEHQLDYKKQQFSVWAAVNVACVSLKGWENRGTMLDAMLRQWNRWRLGCDNSSSAPSHSPCFCHCMHRRGLGLCMHGILGWPQKLEWNVGLLLRLPLPSLIANDVLAISWMCLSFIHQRWQAMMTVHFWSQLIRVMQQ